MPPPAIHQYVTSARPAPTAAAPMRRTAASARAGRVSTVGTGGAVGIASRVVTSTSRCSPVPAPVEPAPLRSGAADPAATDRAVVAVPVARHAAVRTELAAVVAVLARRPCKTGGACRVAPGRGVSDRVAPGPTHREQPRRRSGEQPGAAEVAAARRGRSRATNGTAGSTTGQGRGAWCAAGSAMRSVTVSPFGAKRAGSEAGRPVVRGMCTRRVVSPAVDGRRARRRDVPRRDVLLRHRRGGRLPAGSAVSRVVVAHCSPSVSPYRLGASAGWSR